ncbi:MAG: NUDIX domain-containing protein [Fibrobacterales bacterium]
MQPIVGVGVVVLKGHSLLLGLRKERDGNECWSLPGGKIDPYESITECAIRELKEETNLDAHGLVKVISASNVIDEKNQLHCLTLGTVVTDWSGEVKVTEPHIFCRWEWFPLNQLPDRLFKPTEYVLNGYFAHCGAKQEINSETIVLI